MKREGFGPPVVFWEQASSSSFVEFQREPRYCFPATLTQLLGKMILIEPPRSTIAARREPLNKRELARFTALAAKAAGCSGSVSVLLTSDGRILELNRRFRGKNSPTDVLSFPAVAWGFEAGNGHKGKSVGDLAISLETAARQAESFGHSLSTEVQVLILHGALHLAGFDHESDDGEMARKELRLRRQFGLPSSLIERSSTRARPARAAKTLNASAKAPETKRGKIASRRA
jgi:probable rRNA maturation factor